MGEERRADPLTSFIARSLRAEVSEVSEPSTIPLPTIPLRRSTKLPPAPSAATDMPPYRPRAATRRPTRPSLVRVSRPSEGNIEPLPMPLTRRAR